MSNITLEIKQPNLTLDHPWVSFEYRSITTNIRMCATFLKINNGPTGSLKYHKLEVSGYKGETFKKMKEAGFEVLANIRLQDHDFEWYTDFLYRKTRATGATYGLFGFRKVLEFDESMKELLDRTIDAVKVNIDKTYKKYDAHKDQFNNDFK